MPLPTFQEQRISQSCPPSENIIVSINEKGLTSMVWTEYAGTVGRIRKSTIPISDITAETVAADGAALRQADPPCQWLITWDPTQTVATRPLAIRKDGTWYTYGWDLTKNICEVYGQHGYIRTTYTYSPFGEVTAIGDVAQPIHWSSEYNDTGLNQVHFNYRHYSSVDGRWTVRDRLSEIDNKLKPYDYLANIPLKNTDVSDYISYVQIDETFGHAWIRLGALKNRLSRS